ncbi:MAG: hypothetical protein LEGION0403_FIIPPAGN_00377 [Legionella sp.]|uniref:hypothetical protein n=1 Tax=Legionella sp. TaxID=459 RepID=UPI003D09C48F
MFFKIFMDKTSTKKNDFNVKLKEAIEIIRANQSIVATRVLEVLDSQRITVNSFFNMSPKHYQEIQEDLLKEEHITIPPDYPPTEETVEIMVLSQRFFQAQDGKTLGEFMLRVHKTVQRWIDFQPENAVLF